MVTCNKVYVKTVKYQASIIFLCHKGFDNDMVGITANCVIRIVLLLNISSSPQKVLPTN